MKYTNSESQLVQLELKIFWEEYRNILLECAALADKKAQDFSDVIPPWQKVDMKTGFANIIHMKSSRIQHSSTEKVIEELPDIINYAAFKLAYERMNKRVAEFVRVKLEAFGLTPETPEEVEHAASNNDEPNNKPVRKQTVRDVVSSTRSAKS